MREVPPLIKKLLTVSVGSWSGTQENNYEVAAAIALDGISGIANENMMEYLLNVAKRQGVDTILACDKSCISRDVSELLKIVQQFRENGIRFEYLSQTDAESPVDSLLKLFDNVYKGILLCTGTKKRINDQGNRKHGKHPSNKKLGCFLLARIAVVFNITYATIEKKKEGLNE